MLYEAHSVISVVAHLLYKTEHGLDIACSLTKVYKYCLPLVAARQEIIKACANHSSRRVIQKISYNCHILRLAVHSLEDSPQVLYMAYDADSCARLRRHLVDLLDALRDLLVNCHHNLLTVA